MPISTNNSRFVLVAGAFVSFTLVFFMGISMRKDMSVILRDATIAMFVGGLLTSFFLRVVYNCALDLRRRKLEELAKKEEEDELEEDISSELSE